MALCTVMEMDASVAGTRKTDHRKTAPPFDPEPVKVVFQAKTAWSYARKTDRLMEEGPYYARHSNVQQYL
jgi:hypothetical protein